MIIGILIGLLLFGIVMLRSNMDSPSFTPEIRAIRTYVRLGACALIFATTGGLIGSIF